MIETHIEIISTATAEEVAAALGEPHNPDDPTRVGLPGDNAEALVSDNFYRLESDHRLIPVQLPEYNLRVWVQANDRHSNYTFDAVQAFLTVARLESTQQCWLREVDDVPLYWNGTELFHNDALWHFPETHQGVANAIEELDLSPTTVYWPKTSWNADHLNSTLQTVAILGYNIAVLTDTDNPVDSLGQPPPNPTLKPRLLIEGQFVELVAWSFGAVEDALRRIWLGYAQRVWMPVPTSRSENNPTEYLDELITEFETHYRHRIHQYNYNGRPPLELTALYEGTIINIYPGN